jgi:hypothetical protein
MRNFRRGADALAKTIQLRARLPIITNTQASPAFA